MENVLREHQRIDRALMEIDQLLGPRGPLAPDRLRASIGALAMLLQAHFSHEEASPMFNELPIEYPRFAQPLDRLREEHVEMLTELHHIANEIGKAERPALEKRLRKFMEKLDAHEQVETDILQRAYTEDIAPGD